MFNWHRIGLNDGSCQQDFCSSLDDFSTSSSLDTWLQLLFMVDTQVSLIRRPGRTALPKPWLQEGVTCSTQSFRLRQATSYFNGRSSFFHETLGLKDPRVTGGSHLLEHFPYRDFSSKVFFSVISHPRVRRSSYESVIFRVTAYRGIYRALTVLAGWRAKTKQWNSYIWSLVEGTPSRDTHVSSFWNWFLPMVEKMNLPIWKQIKMLR